MAQWDSLTVVYERGGFLFGAIVPFICRRTGKDFLAGSFAIYGGVQHIAGAANVWYDTSIEDRCHCGW